MTGQGIATVARQEFRLRIRAGRWKVLLLAFFVVLTAFTVLLKASVARVADRDAVDQGTVVYGGLMLFVLGLALLVVPALAAQSVNGDRERGTLALLQVTRLTAGDLTLGKFAAAWGTSLVFLSLTLPLVAYAMTQGGVPPLRVLVVILVLAALLGTVCAISLWLSSVLSRTTTSGVLAYLAVFALTVGTLITFGLATAVTTETYQQSFDAPCPVGDEQCLPGSGQQSFTSTRARTDRTWFLLAPNPFVILADAAPRLPDATTTSRSDVSLQDLDPLGGIGRAVRDLRRPPVLDDVHASEPLSDSSPGFLDRGRARPVWPTGLAIDVALGAGALWHTARRLRAPSRKLPKGQRVA